MSILDRLLGRVRPETRSRLNTWDFVAAGAGAYGAPLVNTEAVLSCSTVATRCVGLRAELLSMVPLHPYRRRDDGGRDRVDDLPLYRVLHERFNDALSAFEGREFLTRSLDLAGNGYAVIERDRDGEVEALFPQQPGLVQVERLPSGRLRYQVSEPAGGTRIVLQEDMLHVRGPSRNGILGLSPLQIARESLGLMLAQTHAAATMAHEGLRSSGFLETGQVLQDGDRTRLQKVLDKFTGSAQAGRVMILEGGMSYKPLSWSPEDAELLASRRLSNEDVARLFGVPPTSVGIEAKATYANSEQQATDLVRTCLAPLAARVEAAMAHRLLTPDQRQTLYIEHDLQGLLRGDTAARFEAYRVGREWGWLSPNDIRRAENLPPIENGDVYTAPLNQAPLGTSPSQSEPRPDDAA